MKITLEPTDKLVTLDGIRARIWQGQSDSGVKVHAFIVSVAVPIEQSAECERFAAELQETAAPRADIAAIPARLVL